MKVVVIGGSGLIGSTVVARLGEHGHEAVAASLQSGVNTLTREGLPEVLQGADVVVDVSNSPSFEDDAVMDFFVTSTTNLIAAEKEAGVSHHVALTVVGSDRLPDSGYLRAKVAQERLIAESDLDHSLVRATQFFEFVTRIADSATVDGKVHLPPAFFQPMAAAEVAAVVARTAVGQPLNAIKEIGGPERVRMDEFIAKALAGQGDEREVVTDVHATYFGTELTGDELAAGPGAELSTVTYAEWSAAQEG